jgi:very-short-patch-repair endonuclease
MNEAGITLMSPNVKLALFGVAGLVILALLALFLKLLTGKPTAPGYTSRAQLLTPAELSFFGVLETALSSQYRICPRIRLADLLTPARTSTRSAFQTAFNQISAKHVDFTICQKSDSAILGVIELDDKSHQEVSRQSRDRFVEQALQSAGIPLLRIKAARGYELNRLSQQLSDLLSPKATNAVAK